MAPKLEIRLGRSNHVPEQPGKNSLDTRHNSILCDTSAIEDSSEAFSGEPESGSSYANSSNRQLRSSNRHGAKSCTINSFFNSKTSSQTRSKSFVPDSCRASSSVWQDPSLEIEDDDHIVEQRSLKKSTSQKYKSVYTKESSSFVRRSNSDDNEDSQTILRLKCDKDPNFQFLASKSWVEEFAPENLDELAVNKKKVASVQSWLDEAINGGKRNRRLLILKGPAGCGKTVTVQILAKIMDINIAEWANPEQVVWGEAGYSTITSQFGEFVNRSAKFQGLQFQGSTARSQIKQTDRSDVKRLLLVEDLPPVSSNRQHIQLQIQNALLEYLEMEENSPMIIVASEEDNVTHSLSDYWKPTRVLGLEVTQHWATTVLEFNGIAATFISKALARVIRKVEQISHVSWRPEPSDLSILSSTGDVRSAVTILQLLYVGTIVQSRPTPAMKRKRNGIETPASLQGSNSTKQLLNKRDDSIGLFHAVGKVIYNKRDGPATFDAPVYLCEHQRPIMSSVNAEELSRSVCAEPEKFIMSLHENFLLSCYAQNTIECLESSCSILSTSDAVSFPQNSVSYRSLWRAATEVAEQLHRDIVLQLAIRGLLFTLPYPVKRMSLAGVSPHKLSFPSSQRLHRDSLNVRIRIENWQIASSRTPEANLQNLDQRSDLAPVGIRTQTQGITNDFKEIFYGGLSKHTISQEPLRRLGCSDLTTIQFAYEDLIYGKASNLVTHQSSSEYSHLDPRNLELPIFATQDNFHGSSIGLQSSTGMGSKPLYLTEDDIEDF